MAKLEGSIHFKNFCLRKLLLTLAYRNLSIGLRESLTDLTSI